MSIESITATIDKAFAAAGLDRRMPDLTRAVGTTLRKAFATGDPAIHQPPFPTSPLRPAQPDRSASPADAADAGGGRFTDHLQVQAHGGVRRHYKLYLPATTAAAAEPMPLIVMLHGCKQDPDDFARGTRMNRLADTHGFAVAYPAQPAKANGSRCWNWFERGQQTRAGSEAAAIACIVDEIATAHPIDRSRVYAAGLSAGAAMAAILGATHPEVFAGVAVHSGLPLGAAHDVPSAFAAMQGGGGMPPMAGGSAASSLPAGLFASAASPLSSRADRGTQPARPTLVIHGDADATVVAANGDGVTAAALAAYAAENRALRESVTTVHAGGRDCQVSRHLDADGRVRVEQWRVVGAAHAWSGGNPAGSYADAAGPDASSEIVRFFLGR